VSKSDGQGTPVVSGSQVFAAGLASTMAAFATSKFGVAGTVLGAALTTMIITGGAAILNAYLESVTGNVRKVPQKLRARRERRERRKAARYAEPPTETLPGRPDLRDNFIGRARAAAGWFSHLSLTARRSIVVKGLIATAVAFAISMGTIYALERGIGNSLSCGMWGNCPEGATPGIHRLGGGDGTGAGSTIGGGRVSQGSGIDRDGGIIGSDQQQGSPLRQQDSVEEQDRGYQPPVQQQQQDRDYQPSVQQQQQDRGYQPPAQRQQDSVEPDVGPVDPNDEEVTRFEPDDGEVVPVDPEVPSEPVQPVPGQPTPRQQAPSE
jgi:hypothetical protein